MFNRAKFPGDMKFENCAKCKINVRMKFVVRCIRSRKKDRDLLELCFTLFRSIILVVYKSKKISWLVGGNFIPCCFGKFFSKSVMKRLQDTVFKYELFILEKY